MTLDQITFIGRVLLAGMGLVVIVVLPTVIAKIWRETRRR
jgi:hypothetical protein